MGSPSLAKELNTLYATDCIGTLKPNRNNVPKQVKEKKLKRGEIFAQHSGPVMVMKWCDKKNVSMVSTYHDSRTKVVSKRGKDVKKPHCVIDYNTNMGGC